MIGWIRRVRQTPAPRTMTDKQFTEYVAGLMRAGGWKRVGVAAPMGALGTDVAGIGADGRRWLVRCLRDASRLRPSDVERFAEAVRQLRRGDVAVLLTATEVPDAVWEAAARSNTTIVEGAGLAWWAGVQSVRPLSAKVRRTAGSSAARP